MFDRVTFKKNAKAQLKGDWGTALLVTLFVAGVFFCVAKAAPIVNLLTTGILSIATAHYYLEFEKSFQNQRPTFAVFIQGFNKWFVGLLSSLWMFLWIFVWTLCFIIPGFVKAFAYSQTLFIVAENPDIDFRKALKMSMAMTSGFKSELFLMYLSFLGWFLLSALTFGILLVWVIPYLNLTSVNAYHFMKEVAITNGSLKESDFYPEVSQEKEDDYER